MTAKSAPTGSSEPALPGVNAATNQLTGVSYDANGNAQSSGSFALAYDMENRMVSATIGSSVTTYSYDASNRRIETVDGVGNDTFYFYAPDGRLLTSFTVPPGVNNGYLYPTHRIYFGSKLIGTTSGVEGGEVPVLADRLGTAQAGYPYGTDVSGVSFRGSNDVDFATYRKDAVTGLEYANQRWYSGGLGRFLTADLYAKSAGVSNPGSWNRYSYSTDDPVNKSDPRGLTVCDENGDNCYDSVDVTDDDPEDDDRDFADWQEYWFIPTTQFPDDWRNVSCRVLYPGGDGKDLIAQNVSIAESKQAQFQQMYPGNPGQANEMFLGWLANQFLPNGAWDYKANFAQNTFDSREAQMFGNFNFGAVLNAIGYSEYMAQGAAGAVQVGICAAYSVVGDFGHCGSGIPFVLFPYGDQTEDQYDIKRGYAYENAVQAAICPD